MREVTFTWAWYVSSKKKGGETEGDKASSWMKDVTLVIKGLRVKSSLEHGTSETEVRVPQAHCEKDRRLESAKDTGSATKTVDIERARGLRGYILKQVDMVIDALVLKVIDFEFVVEMPPIEGPDKQKDAALGKVSGRDGISIVIGGKELQITSFERKFHQSGTEEADKQSSVLNQKLTLCSFFASALLRNDAARKDGGMELYPILEPFSYTVDVSCRNAKRFSSIQTGLEVVGRENERTEHGNDGGITFNAGKVQIEAVTQLGVMMLAPSEVPNETKVVEASSNSINEEKASDDHVKTEAHNMIKQSLPVSTFMFPISSASLVVLDKTEISFQNIAIAYSADGTMLKFESEMFEVKSHPVDNDSAELEVLACALGIVLSMRPNMLLEMESIENLYLPGALRLINPIKKPIVEFEGKTLSLKVGFLEVMVLGKTQKAEVNDDAKAVTPCTEGGQNNAFSVPFAVNLFLEQARISRENNDSGITEFDGVAIYLNPNDSANGTDLALSLRGMKNQLLHLDKAYLYALLPVAHLDEIRGINFAADSVRVTAGHSTKKWSKTFEPVSRVQKRCMKSQVMKCPCAAVAPLKLKISYSGIGVKVKETFVTVKQFKGNDSTTSTDLVNYYTTACISRTPGFISNAEVLGANVVDSTVNAYGSWLGRLNPFGGAAVGLAAVVAVDAVKGTVAAGKRHRNVSEGDQWQFSDVFRGALFSAVEAKRAGAVMRGKKEEDGHIADWAVGAGKATGNYAGANKPKIGAAGGASGGAMIGTILGGPVGGILGGVVAGALTGRSIEKIEEKVKKNRESKINKEDPKRKEEEK